MNYALRHKGKPSEEKKEKKERKLIFVLLNFYNKLKSTLILNMKR